MGLVLPARPPLAGSLGRGQRLHHHVFKAPRSYATCPSLGKTLHTGSTQVQVLPQPSPRLLQLLSQSLPAVFQEAPLVQHLTQLLTKTQLRSLTSSQEEQAKRAISTPLPTAVADHPTLQLLQRRLAQGSKPGCRSDGFKLGLVVEGGGMRGVVTAAMLITILDLGMRDAFDVVYGASAGAINATYFLTGQRIGLDIYTEDLGGTQQFLSLQRMFSGKPIMDLSYLLDHVMRNVKPLDFKAVLESPIPLKVVASSLDSLQSITLDDFSDEEDLVECLKASATVPEIAGPFRMVRGQRLVDAAVFEPVPVKAALRDGCTHVLVLCSRPMPSRAPPSTSSLLSKHVSSKLEDVVKNWMLNPEYMREAWRASRDDEASQEGITLDDFLMQALEGDSGSHQPYNYNYTLPDYEQSDSGRATPSPSSSPSSSRSPSTPPSRHNVLPVYPGSGAAFHPVCTDVSVLEGGIRAGRAAVKSMLGLVMS